MHLTVIRAGSHGMYKDEELNRIAKWDKITYLSNYDDQITDEMVFMIPLSTTHLLLEDVVKLTESGIRRLEHLRYIGTVFTGWWDEYFDVKAIEAKHIALRINESYATNAVAEATLAVLLVKVRHLDNLFCGRMQQIPDGIELHGRSIGIVGSGRIGRRIGRIMTALDMEVHMLDTRKALDQSQLASVEILSINTPKSAGKIINSDFLKKMPKLRIIVNSSGWELIDVDALRMALVSSQKLNYIHIAYPDPDKEKALGRHGTQYYPLFSNKTAESKSLRREIPLRQLEEFVHREEHL